MSENNSQAEQLIKDGITAIKAGERQAGRGMLETAVKLDAYNEQAWLWLARVVDTVEEKRTCLGNVILINPANKNAQKMLEDLESGGSGDFDGASGSGSSNDSGAAGAGGRSRLLIFGLGGLLILIVLAGAFLALSGGDNEVIIPTEFVTPEDTPTLDSAATETAQASITPTTTITPTRAAADVATWTPSPLPSETPLPFQYPAPPDDLEGRILMQSGNVAGDVDNQPIVIVDANDPSSTITVSADGQRGRTPSLLSGSNIFAWSQYLSGSRSYTIQVQRFGVDFALNVTELSTGNDAILDTPSYPTWSENNLAFSAKTLGATTADIWLLTVEDLPGSASISAPAFGDELTATPTSTPTATVTLTNTPTEGGGEESEAEAPPEEVQATPPTATSTPVPTLKRLTEDNADNTWVAFDSTGTALVFTSTTEGETDLRVINVNSLQVFVLTQNGNTLIEEAPDWGIDNRIVFSGRVAGSEESDIYIMEADGSAEPELLLDFGPRDIQPRFSPDGRYIVFSSDINGNFDVYIYDLETEEIYQVTASTNSIDIANDWQP